MVSAWQEGVQNRQRYPVGRVAPPDPEYPFKRSKTGDRERPPWTLSAIRRTPRTDHL